MFCIAAACGWRQPERVGVPDSPCENRRVLRLPIRAAIKEARTKKPQRDCGELPTAFVVGLCRDANPGSTFFVKRAGVYRGSARGHQRRAPLADQTSVFGLKPRGYGLDQMLYGVQTKPGGSPFPVKNERNATTVASSEGTDSTLAPSSGRRA